MIRQGERLVTCPYNVSHSISEKKMLTHLVKCRKNYPGQELAICPIMDTSHHVPKQEYAYHLETCHNRSVVDRDLVQQKSEQDCVAPAPLPISVIQPDLPISKESWENDCHPSYDALASAASKNVVRFKRNAGPAEKKAFQEAERLRLIKLEEEMRAQSPLKPPLQPQGSRDEAVRLPRSQSRATSQF